MYFYKTLNPNEYSYFLVYVFRLKYEEKNNLRPPMIFLKKNNTNEYVVKQFYKLI